MTQHLAVLWNYASAQGIFYSAPQHLMRLTREPTSGTLDLLRPSVPNPPQYRNVDLLAIGYAFRPPLRS
jgi:hypothetical protein